MSNLIVREIGDCHMRWQHMLGMQHRGALDVVAHYMPRSLVPGETPAGWTTQHTRRIFFFGMLHEFRWIRRSDRRIGIQEGMRRAHRRALQSLAT